MNAFHTQIRLCFLCAIAKVHMRTYACDHFRTHFIRLYTYDALALGMCVSVAQCTREKKTLPEDHLCRCAHNIVMKNTHTHTDALSARQALAGSRARTPLTNAHTHRAAGVPQANNNKKKAYLPLRVFGRVLVVPAIACRFACLFGFSPPPEPKPQAATIILKCVYCAPTADGISLYWAESPLPVSTRRRRRRRRLLSARHFISF